MLTPPHRHGGGAASGAKAAPPSGQDLCDYVSIIRPCQNLSPGEPDQPSALSGICTPSHQVGRRM